MLNGDQPVYSTELELLHTPSLQRLYDLHQLGLTDRVFIDASHSRLHHVVGVMEQASRLMRSISENLGKQTERKFPVAGLPESVTGGQLAKMVRADEGKARLIGLLHDLTHAPFGHTLEDEIELVDSKHDEPIRQAAAFYRLILELIWNWARDCGLPNPRGSRTKQSGPEAKSIQQHKDALTRVRAFVEDGPMAVPPVDDAFVAGVAGVAGAILNDPDLHRPLVIGRGPSVDDLRGLIADLRFAMRALLHLELLHKVEPKSKHIPEKDGLYVVEKLLDAILRDGCTPEHAARAVFRPAQHAYLLDVIGNTICADLLDYARRDSFFANLKLDYDGDRIVENMTLVSYEDNKRQWSHQGADPFSGKVLRTAMGMFSHKLRMDVPGALLHLLHVRFYVYQRALFHPTKCVAGAMLGSALQMLGFQEKNLPEHLSRVGDDVFLEQVKGGARLVRRLLQSVAASPGGTGAVEAVDANSKPTPPRSVTPKSPRRVAEVRDAMLAQLSSLEVVGVERIAADIIDARIKLDAPRQAPETADTVDELAWLPRAEHRATIEASCAEVDAALMLLDRLASRRYYRPVFRLLPNVKLPLASLSHETVAESFLKPRIRWFAERTIEQESNLPLGSAVIHCPVATGPAKIAMILMVWRDKAGQEVARPLKEIGELDPHLFGQIQSAIKALEDMYTSMWRLVVSLEPASYAQAAFEARDSTAKGSLFDAGHCTVDSVIAEVLGRVMRRKSAKGGDAAESLPNDWTMREELNVAANGTVGEAADGVPERRLRLTDELLVEIETRTGIPIRTQLDELAARKRTAARPKGPDGGQSEASPIVDAMAKAFKAVKQKDA
ncbi:MAG: HD domain-containing protein [Phycisphaerales bacterium]